jgi:hypothetical protein
MKTAGLFVTGPWRDCRLVAPGSGALRADVRRGTHRLTRVHLDRNENQQLLRLGSELERSTLSERRAEHRASNGDAENKHNRQRLISVGQKVERGSADQNTENPHDDHGGKYGAISFGVQQIGLLPDYVSVVFSRHV